MLDSLNCLHIDSEVKAESSINKFLDKFLSNNYKELEGDGPISLLQEHLQIKPLHMEKLSFPELPDIQRINFKASGVNLPKHRNVLLDVNNLLNGTKNVTSMKLQNLESSVHSFSSPTPPKSPLASLSILKRLIFQLNLSSDSFSTVNIDQLSARNVSPVEEINKDSDPVDVEKTLCTSADVNSLTTKDDGTITNRSSTMAIGDFSSSFERLLNESSLRLASGSEVGVGPRDSGEELADNNVCMDYDVINENLSRADAVVDLQANGPTELEGRVSFLLFCLLFDICIVLASIHLQYYPVFLEQYRWKM